MGKVMDFKMQLLNTGLFKKIRGSQYVCKHCPFCNDSKFHFYVKIEMDEDTPVQYHCKKCVSGGRLGQKFLDYYGLTNIRIPRYKGLRKIDSSKLNSKGVEFTEFDDITDVQNYINKRLGVIPTREELQMFQYVPNPLKYANEYLTSKPLNPKWFTGNQKRHWFRLTNGNIIGRDESEHDGWRKFRTDRIKESGIYTIKLPFDPTGVVDVYITEGIMDSIGLYYGYKQSNNVIYISVLGREYMMGVNHLINTGIFGNNINIKIFKDDDFNKIYIDKYKRKLFKHVDVYQNMIGKDYGVRPEEMDINKIMSL